VDISALGLAVIKKNIRKSRCGKGKFDERGFLAFPVCGMVGFKMFMTSSFM